MSPRCPHRHRHALVVGVAGGLLLVLLVLALARAQVQRPAGGTVTATWTNIATPTGVDWIGLYVPGTPDWAWIVWRYLNGATDGHLPFHLPSTLAPGSYDVRLFSDNGYTRLATSNVFLVTAPSVTLTVAPPTVAAGGTLVVTWTGIAQPSTTDWLGLYTPGSPNTAFLAWIYVSCTHVPATAHGGGTCTFPLPGTLAPGTYEVRVCSQNGFQDLATSAPLRVQ